MNIAVIFHSGYGHTKAIAEAVVDGVKEITNVEVTLISVEVIDQYWDFLNNQVQAIIFGSPTYMGGVSAQFKVFMDASSKHWGSWRDKLASGFTCSASRSGDKLSTLQHLSVFAAQHQMLWVSLGVMPGNNNSQGSEDDVNRLGSSLGMMAQANADQGIEGIRSSDKETAKILGKRVAQATLRWNR